MKIPAERFFKIIETGDLRWIQIVKDDEFVKCPEYDMLESYQIVTELFDKANETRMFLSNNMQAVTDLQKGSKMLAMVLGYYMFDFGQAEKAVEFLKNFKINLTPDDFGWSRLINMIETNQTMLNIKALQKGDDKKDETTYIDTICSLEEIIGQSIEAETITLEKYIAKTKRAKEKINALKKQSKNYGRGNQTR